MTTDNNKYPGYPHYPAKDDITRHDNNNGRILEDELNTTEDATAKTAEDDDASITAEDLQLLDAAENGSTDDDANLAEAELDDVDDDGEPLNEASSDISGKDLDVPGSEQDDSDEEVGEEDEENNFYSLGGDNHESQEENNGDQ